MNREFFIPPWHQGEETPASPSKKPTEMDRRGERAADKAGNVSHCPVLFGNHLTRRTSGLLEQEKCLVSRRLHVTFLRFLVVFRLLIVGGSRRDFGIGPFEGC